MTAMDETIASDVLKTLAEIGPGRLTRLDALASYVNGRALNYVGRDAVQAALNHLKARGLARCEESPLSPAVLSWSVTAAGLAVAATLP
jgi:hypothetical protein